MAWSDELVGRLDAVLAETGLRDNTLFVVTADHGEGLDEHGEAVHGFFVYETTLHVPLILRGPRVTPGTRIERVTRSIDLMPTMLDLVGLADATPAMSGRSLAPALAGKTLTDEPTFAESLTPLIHYGWSDLRAVRDGRWKYILAPRPELYDLDQDPGELHNLVDRDANRARAYRSGVEQQLRREQAALRGSEPAAATVPPDMLEKLGALGYVSPGGVSAERASGADPKDKIEEYKTLNTLMREGLVGLREGRFGDSLARFQALFGHGVSSFESHYYAARALTGLKRWREATVHYEAAIAKLPAYTAAYIGLADAALADGKVDLALDAVRRGEKAVPDDPRLIEREGDIERRRGRSGSGRPRVRARRAAGAARCARTDQTGRSVPRPGKAGGRRSC